MPVYCMGLGGSNHDYATCITRGEEILVAIEEERLARRRYAIGVNSLFTKSRQYCLDAAGLSMDDIDAIVADDTLMPGVYFPMRQRTELIRHHVAHLASAFFPSSFERAAIMVVDGAGSFFETRGVETLTYGLGEGGSVTEIGKVYGSNWDTDHLSTRRVYQIGESDDSLGYMYKIVSRAIGFVSFEDENWFHTDDGKTMGLAPYGTDRLHRGFREFLELREEGQFALKVKGDGLAAHIDHIVAQADGVDDFQLHADLAWAAQALVQETLLHAGRHLHAVTGCDDVCLAGGVALNCVANGVLLREGPFERIFIQPAAGDAGNALGCALYGLHVLLGMPRTRTRPMRHAYLGRHYTTTEIGEAIGASRLPFAELPQPAAATARLLAEGRLIGWFQGGSEFGPRALGHRSILADPRDPTIKDTLNSRVKHREWFRPFAPAVLEEQMADWFELEVESPFMLLVAHVRPDKRDTIPGVVHVDGTARVQSLTHTDNGLFFELVQAFAELTSVPVILNTSLNDRGAPIVERPEEALEFFAMEGLDLLVMDRFVVAHDEQSLAAALRVTTPAEDLL
jgi:carbamoyltransferase